MPIRVRNIVIATAIISLASQPTLILSADRFQYRHEDKWSGDLGSIHVNPWNAITE